MAEAPTYVIETPIDFLKVPVDRLGACLEEFRSFLAAYIAVSMATDGAATPSGTSFTWIDDGENKMHVTITAGDEVLSAFSLPAGETLA